MRRLLSVPSGRVVTCLLAWAALSGCGAHEQDCELNPYACPAGGEGGNGGAGAAGGSGGGHGGGHGTCAGEECCPADLVCPPCEECGASGGCEPVELASSGACPVKQTCAADLTCKKKNGQPCFLASECASGSCDDDSGACQACAGESDCAGLPGSPHCNGGWCKQPDGAACATDLQCRGNRCLDGVCASCTTGAECESGSCDAASSACLLATGQPCQADAECASSKCSGSFVCLSP